MKKHSKNLFKEIDIFFRSPPSSNQKAWGIINDFYHMILTYMEENNINKSDLAKRLGKSRSAISQMFNKTPNISVKKMVEISDAIGINLKITSDEIPMEYSSLRENQQKYIFVKINFSKLEKIEIANTEKKDEYPSNLNTSFVIPYSNEYKETFYN